MTDTLKIGDHVEITGAAAFNGKTGSIVDWYPAKAAAIVVLDTTGHRYSIPTSWLKRIP